MNSSLFDLIGIDPAYVILGLFVIMIILIIILFCTLKSSKNRIRELEKKYSLFMKGSDGETLEASILEKFDDIDTLKEENDRKTKMIKKLQKDLRGSFQKVGLVKYDAFKEMGGNLSFALALLNKDNTGFVLNAMHSREGCYTYIKEIIKGESFIMLAEEEKEALDQAIQKDHII